MTGQMLIWYVFASTDVLVRNVMEGALIASVQGLFLYPLPGAHGSLVAGSGTVVAPISGVSV